MSPEIQKMQVATANKLLSEKKIRGNISMIDRKSNTVFFCPVDVNIDAKNMVAVPMDDKLIEAEDSLYPEDLLFHFAIYRSFPQAVSVSHTFPTYAAAFANTGNDIHIYEAEYASDFPDGIRCINTSVDNYPEKFSANKIENAIQATEIYTKNRKTGAILFLQNGALVWDATPQKAFERTIKMEQTAESAYCAHQTGEEIVMSPKLANYYYEKKLKKEVHPSHGIPGTPVTNEERKKISLEMLTYFDKVCRDNGVHYSITGGTLLGAVRHGGFIPWDDDVDVFMTRPEYEKIRELLPDNERFILLDRRKLPDYDFVYGRLIDTKTIITESPGTLNAGTGVFMDICIVDGLPRNKILCKLHIKHMWILTRSRLAARRGVSIREPSLQTYKKHGFIGGRLRFIYAKLLRKFTTHLFWNSRMEKVMSRYPVENAQYVGNFATQYGKREKLEKTVFDSYIDLEFEGCRVMACEQYEKYLISIYGNYAQLPILKKRKGHHPGTVYWV